MSLKQCTYELLGLIFISLVRDKISLKWRLVANLRVASILVFLHISKCYKPKIGMSFDITDLTSKYTGGILKFLYLNGERKKKNRGEKNGR